jgi:hypothetical protein
MANLDFITTDCEDLACHTGVTFEADLLFTNECSGVPDDLTGYTCSMKIYYGVETAILDTITGDMTQADNGLVSFSIPASKTQTYDTGIYKHNIDLTLGSTVYRIAQGFFEVSE